MVERFATFHHYYPIGVYTPFALTVTFRLPIGYDFCRLIRNLVKRLFQPQNRLEIRVASLRSLMLRMLLGLIFPSQEGGLGYEYRRIHAGDGIAAPAVPVLHLRLQVMPLAPHTLKYRNGMGSHIISS